MSTIYLIKFQLYSTIISRISLFVHDSFFASSALLAAQTSKWAKFGDKGAGKMKLDSCDDGDDNELTSVGVLEISKRFGTQGGFFYGTLSSDGVKMHNQHGDDHRTPAILVQMQHTIKSFAIYHKAASVLCSASFVPMESARRMGCVHTHARTHARTHMLAYADCVTVPGGVQLVSLSSFS